MRLWLELVIVLFPQCALAATPLSFSNFHPDALDFRAASDTNVAAADLENLHDEEEEGEEEGGKDPVLLDPNVRFLFSAFRRTFGLGRLQAGRCRRRAHQKPSRALSTAM